MRGRLQDQSGLFSYIRPEERIPAAHPLRKVRELVRELLKELSHGFGKLYSHEGRPSIPPEQLLSALLLQVFYGIRSERQLMEQLNYNLLFCWFVGLSPDDSVWDPTVFTKNRDWLQQGDVFQKFMTNHRLGVVGISTSIRWPVGSAASLITPRAIDTAQCPGMAA